MWYRPPVLSLISRVIVLTVVLAAAVRASMPALPVARGQSAAEVELRVPLSDLHTGASAVVRGQVTATSSRWSRRCPRSRRISRTWTK